MIIIQPDENKQEIIKLKVKTIKSERHVSVVSNRIWGGTQLNNLFELNFILEHVPLPDSLTIEIGKNGVEKELSRSSNNEMIREIQATVYLNSDTLLSLQAWLNAQVQNLQNLKLIERKE